MSEQLPSLPAEPQWAALAAIDWGDQRHCWALQPAGKEKLEQGELENTPEAVEAWAMELYQRFGGRPVAVALEQKRGAVVYMLIKYAHLTLYPVPPAMSASYRQTFCPSGAKDDAGDTKLLLDLLQRHRERLQRWQPDTEETRLLQFLVEDRRRLVNEKTRQVLRLTDCLKQYFPQVLHWFGKVDSRLVGDLLERWPDLQHLQRVRPDRLRTFLHAHHCRGEEHIQARIQAIYAATAAATDAAVLEACSRKAGHLVQLIRLLGEQIEQLDQRIRELVAAHPDGPLFDSLPGAGEATIPRLIAAFGTQRDRYHSAYQLQCYSGIAPVKEASGQSQWTHFRFVCPKFLRQTFHEFAGQSIPHSEWAKAYYQHQLARGKSHHAALRALGYKWIRIIFRCWKDGCPYDEQRYLNSMRRRGALLGPALASATASATVVGWKSVAGFKKFCLKNS